MSGRSWRLHLLDERSPLTLLPFPLVLVFYKQHLAEPDPFDYTFVDDDYAEKFDTINMTSTLASMFAPSRMMTTKTLKKPSLLNLSVRNFNSAAFK